MRTFSGLIFFLSSSLLASAQDGPGERLAESFRKLDVDGNGKVTAEEAPQRARIIRMADADGSGDVTLAELAAFFRTRRQPDSTAAEPVTKIEADFPENAPLSPASCRNAAAYSDVANGHAVVIMHRGRILFEHYTNGWSAKKPHRLASGTKSFSGAMLAAAVKDGLIAVDEPVSRTITEWRDDEALAAITIRQLLSLTSGLHPGKVGQVPGYGEAVKNAMVRDRPGTKFAYGPAPFQIFGEVMKRKTGGKDPLLYLKKRILDPIGLEVSDWRRDQDGNPKLPSGVHLRATEWIKFGEFLRTDGGKVLDPGAFAACVTGSKANPRYGLTFWLSERGYQASGAGKQRLYVLPEHELVVVRFGETRGNRFQDTAFLTRLLAKSEKGPP